MSLDASSLVSVSTLSPREVERRAQAAELDALARASRPVTEGAAGLANIEAARRQRTIRAEEAVKSRARNAVHAAGVEFQLEHAHELPIPENAPPHIVEAIERVRAMSPDERAAHLRRMGIEAAPERTRGRFTLESK